ncbi:MAG: hypothetical protein AB1792_03400 [Candidatus Zixiibacteriota bacterium]
MDIMTDPLFWGEVGLAVASKLALLAAVLWVARMAISAHTPTPMTDLTGRTAHARRLAVREGVAATTQPAVAAQESTGRAPLGYINLRRAPERLGRATPPPDQLRQRLLEFVERRSAERTRP